MSDTPDYEAAVRFAQAVDMGHPDGLGNLARAYLAIRAAGVTSPDLPSSWQAWVDKHVAVAMEVLEPVTGDTSGALGAVEDAWPRPDCGHPSTEAPIMVGDGTVCRDCADRINTPARHPKTGELEWMTDIKDKTWAIISARGRIRTPETLAICDAFANAASPHRVLWLLKMAERVRCADGCVGTVWLRQFESGPGDES